MCIDLFVWYLRLLGFLTIFEIVGTKIEMIIKSKRDQRVREIKVKNNA